MDETPAKELDASGAVKEYEAEDFGDDKFDCECPRCGFKFNR